MHRQGHVNSVFGVDVDKIEVAPSTSSHSDLNSTGSQSFLTDSHTNFRFTNLGTPEGSRMGSPNNMIRRWSQNMSRLGKGKKSVRDKTVFRLPSRKAFAVDGQFIASTDLEIDQLANEIEQHEYMMHDSAAGEHLRMDTIRALPHPLTTKRRIKERLSITITRQSRNETTTFLKRLKYRVSMLWSHLWGNIRSTLYSIELWYESMKEIEGHFGSGVGTYFKFLRWLFSLNAFLLIFVFSFITLPQILYDSRYKSEHETNTTKTLRPLDLLTAEGYLKNSILFYGAYSSETFGIGGSHTYSIPHAYFMTMLCMYLCTFVIISTSMARSYRKSFIETSGGVRNMYAHKIFCSWDFGISNLKAAQLKHASVYHELKEVLSEMRGSKEKLPKLWKFWMLCSQITAHLLVGGMLSGLGVAMWILLQQFGEENESSPWGTLYLSIAVNITILVLQKFFYWIAKMEDYRSPRRTLHITLLRNFMLEAVIIGVLVIFWLTKEQSGCWETSIGQEIYRLVIVDFFISVFFSSLLQVIQVHVVGKIWPSIGKPEFDISRKSLGLVFNQTLLWVGLLFSPLLSVVVVLKMIITFYIKKLTLLYLCKSPSQLWRSAQTQTLYLVITFLSLLGVLLAHGYIMTQVQISQKCGPFRGHDFMFQIFIDGVLELKENHWIWRAIIAVARPAVMGGVLLSMVVVVYYLRSKSKARRGMVKLLKEMLYLEAKDKEFLLLNITKITQDRGWLFDDEDIRECGHRRDNFAETSSTWRYQSGNIPEEPGVRCRHI